MKIYMGWTPYKQFFASQIIRGYRTFKPTPVTYYAYKWTLKVKVLTKMYILDFLGERTRPMLVLRM